ncbi:MAG TPA: DUF5069 domain-containing protein [Opitutaceae bacterium]|jgi:gluconokinase
MANVPGLRSPYSRVGRLIFFGRMLDKIRLHADGKLPEAYAKNLGDAQIGFLDGRVCRFLGVAYPDMVKRTLASGTDDEILAWAESDGRRKTDEECYIFNSFVAKRGWRDERTAVMRQMAADHGLDSKPIDSILDFIDFDEGRDPAEHRGWICA